MIELQPMLFIIGLIAVVVGMFWALQLTRKRLAHTEEELLYIQNSLVALKSTGIGQGKRIINVDYQLKKIANKQQNFQSHDVPEKSYKQAAKMLAMGVDANEIMDCCGLNRGEIQLLIQLHSASNIGKSYH